MKWNVSYTHPDSPNSNGRNSQATGTSFRFGMDPTAEGYYVKAAKSKNRLYGTFGKRSTDIEVP